MNEFYVTAKKQENVKYAIMYEKALNSIVTPRLIEAVLEVEDAAKEAIKEFLEKPVDKPKKM